MTNEPALTVDSLHSFKYKKRFSFANRATKSSNSNEQLEEPENLEVLADISKNESETEMPTVKPSPKKATVLKGSAKIKGSEDSDSSSSEKKKKKVQRKKKGSDSEEDSEVERIERDLQRLYKMYAHMNRDNVKSTFFGCDMNVKKAIDALVRQDMNEGDETDTKECSETCSIDEWSDGDEKIRAKNKAKKEAKKKSKNFSDESTASSSISANSSSTNENKKRKNAEKIESVKEPLKKKIRRVIVESDEGSGENNVEVADSTDEEVNDKSAKTKNLSGNKRVCIKSSDEEENESHKKKHDKNAKSKSKSKAKKEKKKKPMIDEDGEGASNDDGEEYGNDDMNGDSDNSDTEEQLSDQQKVAILGLFNNASVEEIQSMMSISTKRLDTLLSLRPFENFNDLRQRLSQRSLLPYIDSAKGIIYARNIVNTLLEKCQNISQKLEQQVTALVESSENNGNSSKHAKLEIKFQPKLLNQELQLKPYQLIGLNWLCLMHKENINGILADEMGLGKTCQTIAFLTHLLEANSKLTHLIIVPPSTLDNWVREISTWSPNFYFTVYQGNLEERRQLRYNILNNKFEKHLNCILTTYGLISSTNEDKAFFKKLKLEYCVFDEAHMLKNMNSIRYQSLIQIKSRRKLLLTGTPLQNNIVELMSLLYFVLPDFFHLKTQYLNKIFATKPANVDKDTFYTDKISQAKGIMKPFIMRRLKTEVLKQLPKKKIEVIYCDMTMRQIKEYNSLIEYYKKRKDQFLKEAQENVIEKAEKALALTQKNKSCTSAVAKFNEVFDILETDINAKKAKLNEKKSKENEDNSSNIIMELRKGANHPLLRRSIYNDDKLKKMARLIMNESSADTNFDYVVEDMSVMNDFQIHKLCPLYRGLKGFELDEQSILDSGKFKVLNSLLEEKKELGNRVLIFSQFVIMLDIVEEFLKIKSYKYLRLDGTTAVNERQDMIDNYNEDNEIFIFLLSTKAGGMGINLTAANVVIMHDIDYNPFNDKQAEDRCHRVGQTREVQVYKLISKNSIDETMLKIQERKLELGADISGENDENQAKYDMISMLKDALKTA